MRTSNSSTLAVMLFLGCIVTGTTAAVSMQENEHKPRKVKRVKRPVFTQKDWDGIYFDNLFEDGLVGPRPSAAEMTKKPQAFVQNTGESQNEDSGVGQGWSKIIPGDVIEDEVKALEQALSRDITTPGKFKSEYLKTHTSYSMLSMLFGIIREYDDDIRWKKYSDVAQVAFSRSAAASRVGTEQAYQNAKRRRDELTEMVRGGNFTADEKATDEMDWSQVIGRSPIMERLQLSIDAIKPAISNKTEFNKNMSVVYHEASLVAAMGRVLIQENMDEADDDGYADFAKSMTNAAVQVVDACKTNNYDSASAAANLIEQSCSNCHEEWR